MPRSYIRDVYPETRIRLTPKYLYSDEASDALGVLIHTGKVTGVEVRQRVFSPIVLLMPMIAGTMATVCVYFLVRRPPPISKVYIWGIPLLLAGYAIHAMVHFVRAREYTVRIIAPSVSSRPIDFYFTEDSSRAERLKHEIEAVRASQPS